MDRGALDDGASVKESKIVAVDETRRALARVDMLLSAVQDEMGRYLLTHGVRLVEPLSHKRATEAYADIEQARRSLTGSGRRVVRTA